MLFLYVQALLSGSSSSCLFLRARMVFASFGFMLEDGVACTYWEGCILIIVMLQIAYI
jgi:hypothetical protein